MIITPALRDRCIGRRLASLGGCRLLREAETAPPADDRSNLWRARLIGTMRPNAYTHFLAAGYAARERLIDGFARIDREKAEAKRRVEEAQRAEFDPRIVAVNEPTITVRRPRLSLAR